MKTYTIEESFIRQAHKAACQQWKTKIEEKFPEVFPKVIYKVGNRFKLEQEEFILANIGDKQVQAISLKDGGRWNGGTRVEDISNITESELRRILSTYFEDFKLIK